MRYNLAKLDAYDYILLPGVVRIAIGDPSDPILVDVMSEINNSNDLFYVEGRYYQFLGDYEIGYADDGSFLDLAVVEVREDLISDILNSLGDDSFER